MDSRTFQNLLPMVPGLRDYEGDLHQANGEIHALEDQNLSQRLQVEQLQEELSLKELQQQAELKEEDELLKNAEEQQQACTMVELDQEEEEQLRPREDQWETIWSTVEAVPLEDLHHNPQTWSPANAEMMRLEKDSKEQEQIEALRHICLLNQISNSGLITTEKEATLPFNLSYYRRNTLPKNPHQFRPLHVQPSMPFTPSYYPQTNTSCLF